MAKTEHIADLVRDLANLLKETGLSEIEYGKDDWRIRVARGSPAAIPSTMTPPPASTTADQAESPAETAANNAMTSPMVGTVYRSAEPGGEPFVEVGDEVVEGQTLLLIEAMKTFNEIRAPRAGKVEAILVADGSPVEYGDPLLILD